MPKRNCAKKATWLKERVWFEAEFRNWVDRATSPRDLFVDGDDLPLEGKASGTIRARRVRGAL